MASESPILGGDVQEVHAVPAERDDFLADWIADTI
jgi:hypothetical protein